METKIILYGASGHCKVIIDILELSQTEISIILDENPKIHSILNRLVSIPSEIRIKNTDILILSIGNNRIRKELSAKLIVKYATAIHPSSIISEHSKIGEGTVVMASAVINAAVSIGKHSIINTGAIIEHDCIIEDFVHLSPNVTLGGNVTVGEGTQIGIGAIVIQGIIIGKWCTIGAGAVIIRDVPDYAVVVGNPGKIIKYNIIKE
jgi:sugar O-acyltransferase (sialic acid O-acetyltransferase NeuD family)